MKKQKFSKERFKQQLPLHLMLLLPIVLLVVYSYGPMLGLVMAFQRYIPSNKGFFYSLMNSPWVGLDHFRYMLNLPDIGNIMWNTIFISTMKLVAKIIFPLLLAILLNEIRKRGFRNSVQTITFLPYFLSWVILGGILLDIFSPRAGLFTMLLQSLKIEPIYLFGNAKIFPYVLVVSDLWKEIGFNTIIFLAALTGIDPSLLEAAAIDGAGRFKQVTKIIIPGITGMVILVTVLGLGNILNAGFDQVFNLYNPMVYSTGDIIDTATYRMGIRDGQYSLATAIGLFKNVISFVLVVISYKLANKYSNYRIF